MGCVTFDFRLLMYNFLNSFSFWSSIILALLKLKEKIEHHILDSVNIDSYSYPTFRTVPDTVQCSGAVIY